MRAVAIKIPLGISNRKKLVMNVAEIFNSSVIKWLQKIQRTPLQGTHTRGTDDVEALAPVYLHPVKNILIGPDACVIDINAGLCLE